MIAGLLCLPLAACGGLARRCAGGLLNQWFGRAGQPIMGDLPTRLLFAASLAAAWVAGGAPAWSFLVMLPCCYVGTAMGNHGGIGMGRGDDRAFWADAGRMTWHGFDSMGFPILAAWLLHYDWHWERWWPVGTLGSHHYAWWWIMVTCLIAAVPYEVGYMLAGRTGNCKFPPGFQGGAEIGEFLWGGIMAVGMYLAARG